MHVDFQDVQGVLQLYCLSLAGTDVQVVEATEPAHVPGGATVCLPPVTARYDNRQDNFDWLKVMATHQVAHLEFGGTGVVQLPGWVAQPRLAYDLFRILEEGRLDARMAFAYLGLRRALRRAQAEALASRRSLDAASPLTAVLELLVRMGLGAFAGLPVPAGCETVVRELAAIVRTLHGPHAAVQDSAAAAVRACGVLSGLLEKGDEGYETPDPVDYRGPLPGALSSPRRPGRPAIGSPGRAIRTAGITGDDDARERRIGAGRRTAGPALRRPHAAAAVPATA